MRVEPRLSIGGILRSATQRIAAHVQGEKLEVVQLKAALQKHASAVASAGSKEELVAALARVVDTAFSLAATQGVPRATLEGRLQPAAHTRSVFRQVSELRSSMARAHGAKLHETVTIVTQRFLGSRSMPLTRVRSFTRVVPAARDWTLDAMELRWLRPAGSVVHVPAGPAAVSVRPPAVAAGSVARPMEIPTVVLSSSRFRSARWLGRRPPRVPVGNARTTALTIPPRATIASGKEFARWAVSASSQLFVERFVLPYLRRIAAQHLRTVAAGSFGPLLRAAAPLGLQWVVDDQLRND